MQWVNMATGKLTAKQQLFAAEYLVDLNATQAAIRAGYAQGSARQQGHRLLTNADIAAAVAERQAAQLSAADLTAERVKRELARVCFANVKDLFEGGNLKPIAELTDDQAAAIAGFEVIIKNAQAGDGVTDLIHKVKSWDKVRALELGMKHLGLLDEQVDVRIDDQVIMRLQRGRAHNAEWRKKREARKKAAAA